MDPTLCEHVASQIKSVQDKIENLSRALENEYLPELHERLKERKRELVSLQTEQSRLSRMKATTLTPGEIDEAVNRVFDHMREGLKDGRPDEARTMLGLFIDHIDLNRKERAIEVHCLGNMPWDRLLSKPGMDENDMRVVISGAGGRNRTDTRGYLTGF